MTIRSNNKDNSKAKSQIKKRKYNRYLKFYDFNSMCFCDCLYFKENIDPKTGHKKNCKHKTKKNNENNMQQQQDRKQQ